MTHHPVIDLLNQWPSRRAILDDARALDPELPLIVVHRWFHRSSVPPKYWLALLAGAKRRKIKLKSDDFVRAHAAKSELRVHTSQDGDVTSAGQGAA